MFDHDTIVDAAHTMSSAYRTKRDTGVGEPEAALRAPLVNFLEAVVAPSAMTATFTDETLLSQSGVKPDYAVFVDGQPLPAGFIEVKKPGFGVDTSKYVGRDKQQWLKIRDLPNVLYTDGQSWALYRFGQRVLEIQTFTGDLDSGDHAPTDPEAWATLLESFLGWQPSPPASVGALADVTSRLCRLLRAEVTAALKDSEGLQKLSKEWRNLLFPQATDERFADQYAQTVTFGLLLARAESIELSDQPLLVVADQLKSKHGLLGVALQLLTDSSVVGKLATSLRTMQSVIGSVEWDKLVGKAAAAATGAGKSPWLHFYEDFLARYDPDLRKETGSYYTPDAVVDVTVRLVDEALRTHLGMPLGFVSDGVTVVDPAVGTGTYLLDVVDKAAASIAADKGASAVPQRLADFAQRLVGFEIQTGPYAVAQMRLAASLSAHMGDAISALPADAPRLYVADTLDDPYIEQTSLGSVYEPISRSRTEANKVKSDERVVVVLGNPPYRNKAKGQGGWVEKGNPNTSDSKLLDDFLPSDQHGPGGNQTQELRNLYVYFLRWAAWKAFEAHSDSPNGIVAFITSSAWLTVDGLVGVREHLGSLADHIYVIDLGGEQRGARKEDNVFDIKTPVAVTVMVRDGSRSELPAVVHYRRIRGSRQDKYLALGSDAEARISLNDEGWTTLPVEPHERWSSAAAANWTRHPALTDLFPWAAPGVKPNRTWVYAPEESTLTARWETLASEDDSKRKKELFKESYHAKFDKEYPDLPGYPHAGTIKDETGPCPPIVRVTYRSFDRQWVIADRRLLHSPSPSLWRAMSASSEQLVLSHNHKDPVGRGPALLLGSMLTDQGHFNGRNDVSIPLWKSPGEPNVAPGLIDTLTAKLGLEVSPLQLMAYCAAIASHGGFTDHFWGELETPGVRIPLTADPGTWHVAVLIGLELTWVHTFGERCADAKLGRPSNHVRADSLTLDVTDVAVGAPMPETMTYDEDTMTVHFGDGSISGVPQAVWDYEVSGMRILDQWFGYRKAKPDGKKSSPLDNINPTEWSTERTNELFELIHVLGKCVELEPLQGQLLKTVLDGPLITTADLTDAGVLPIPAAARSRPTEPAPEQESLDI